MTAPKLLAATGLAAATVALGACGSSPNASVCGLHTFDGKEVCGTQLLHWCQANAPASNFDDGQKQMCQQVAEATYPEDEIGKTMCANTPDPAECRADMRWTNAYGNNNGR